MHAASHMTKTARVLAQPEAWSTLAEKIRAFDADVIVLVARKMPRVVDALQLNLGDSAVSVSDQAIPFVGRELKHARVAIVDDVWNVGTTMMRARDRVLDAGPSTVRLFALGARDATEAQKQGVNLILSSSLTEGQYRSLVESVPRALKLVPKPFDVDFPIIPCLLRAPFSRWSDCWSWLKFHFGEYVHATNDEMQLSAGYGRASVSVTKERDWTIKGRLYFDFRRGTCNVVPLGLASALPLVNDYPTGSLSEAIFDALGEPLVKEPKRGRTAPKPIDRDASSRVKTFCDSLLFAEAMLESLDGLLQRETLAPFAIDDVQIQFGPQAARNCEKQFNREFRRLNRTELKNYVFARKSVPSPDPQRLSENERIVGHAQKLLQEGLPVLAFDSMLSELARAVGANDPAKYSLEQPYNLKDIQQNPYLRLRLGFTFEEIVDFFRRNFNDRWNTPRPVELLVSALVDLFIDQGAMVPTFALHNDVSTRIYRKGEANPRWDEEIGRLQFALQSLNDKDRSELLERGRTRVAKINAILSLSGTAPTSLDLGSLERGTVGALISSVVERDGGELTGFMRRLGLWK
jgi:hypothetical protein